MKQIIKFLILAISILALFIFTLAWWKRFNMSYNELGRYFDGVVVWHEQGIIVYALLSLFSFISTVVVSVFIWKKRTEK